MDYISTFTIILLVAYYLGLMLLYKILISTNLQRTISNAILVATFCAFVGLSINGVYTLNNRVIELEEYRYQHTHK